MAGCVDHGRREREVACLGLLPDAREQGEREVERQMTPGDEPVHAPILDL
jgi:hypothetical protein